jgi:hypothetical protein
VYPIQPVEFRTHPVAFTALDGTVLCTFRYDLTRGVLVRSRDDEFANRFGAFAAFAGRIPERKGSLAALRPRSAAIAVSSAAISARSSFSVVVGDVIRFSG